MNLEIDSKTSVKYFYDGDVYDVLYYNNNQKGVSWLSNRGRDTTLDWIGGIPNSKTVTFIPITTKEAYHFIYEKATPLYTPNNLTINDGDKICFMDSSFPSLLLGRLGLNIKRTTKFDTADKIVSDCLTTESDIFRNVVLIDKDKKGICKIGYHTNNETVTGIDTRIKTTIGIFSKIGYNMELYIAVSKQGYETYQSCKKHSSKIISTKSFTKYVVSSLPVLQDDEVSNICYMLKSQDASTVSTALGTLQYYNFANHIPEVIEAIIGSSCYDLPNNREATYIYSLFGLDRGTFIAAKGYGIRRQIQFFMDCLNKFVVTPSMTVKQKVYTSLRSLLFDKISSEYKDEMSKLNVSLSLTPNDEDGKTTASTKAVEGA